MGPTKNEVQPQILTKQFFYASQFSSSVLYFYVSLSTVNTKPFPSAHSKQLLTTNNTKGSHPSADSQQLLPSSPWSATTATTYVIAEPTPPSTKPDLSKPWQNLLQQLLHVDLLLFASCSSWSQPPKLLIEPI